MVPLAQAKARLRVESRLNLALTTSILERCTEPSRSECLLERGVVEAFTLLRKSDAVNSSCAAVDDDRNGAGLSGHGDEH